MVPLSLWFVMRCSPKKCTIHAATLTALQPLFQIRDCPALQSRISHKPRLCHGIAYEISSNLPFHGFVDPDSLSHGCRKYIKIHVMRCSFEPEPCWGSSTSDPLFLHPHSLFIILLF